jgi:hypothetical protein
MLLSGQRLNPDFWARVDRLYSTLGDTPKDPREPNADESTEQPIQLSK